MEAVMAITSRIRLMVATGFSLIDVLPMASALVAAFVASTAASFAQEARSEAAPYCADLKRVAALATARDRFAAIAGKPREGNFRDTTLSLTGWKDCSLYGAAIYTCESEAVKTAAD